MCLAGVERRVTLSSIRAPKPGNRDRAGEPLARESKEFLRQRIIGMLMLLSIPNIILDLNFCKSVKPACSLAWKAKDT